MEWRITQSTGVRRTRTLTWLSLRWAFCRGLKIRRNNSKMMTLRINSSYRRLKWAFCRDLTLNERITKKMRIRSVHCCLCAMIQIMWIKISRCVRKHWCSINLIKKNFISRISTVQCLSIEIQMLAWCLIKDYKMKMMQMRISNGSWNITSSRWARLDGQIPRSRKSIMPAS